MSLLAKTKLLPYDKKKVLSGSREDLEEVIHKIVTEIEIMYSELVTPLLGGPSEPGAPGSTGTVGQQGSVSAGDLGSITGMQVTIKDSTNLYVWGGNLKINDTLYYVTSLLTYPATGLTPDTLYYLYVNAPSSGNILTATEFTLSTTAPAYDHAKGAYYKTGDGTKRWLANVRTY